MSMSPGPAGTGRKHRKDGLARSTSPATDASSTNGGSSRGASVEPSDQSATPGIKANKPTPTKRSKTLTSGPSGSVTPQQAQQGSSGLTQLLRKVSVAGVTVEVVRQENRIIYRLPGNMPVSSLTPEQRAKVMDEIQRMRDSGATTPTNGTRTLLPGAPYPKLSVPTTKSSSRPVAAKQENTRTPAQIQEAYSRPRPALPSIAPRPFGADNETAAPQSAPLPGSLASPDALPGSSNLSRKQRQATQSRPLSAMTLSKSQQRSASPSPSSSPATTQKSALEKMYQSAYLKLLSGPAEVLRKLNPPVELNTVLKNSSASAIGSGDEKNAVAPAMLLQILKALTKAQASQIATMYDRELRAGRNSLEISTNGLRGMGTVSQPQSREGSPVTGNISGTEFDGYADAYGSSALIPTNKRKVGKMANPLVSKKRSISTSEPATGNASPIRGEAQTGPKPLLFAHADMVRQGLPPLAERRKRPNQILREAEIGKRFHQALAMDQQMACNADWRTPFCGTRDIVQRLLPFHVFQYPDAVVDSATRQIEDRIARSTDVLGRRLGNLSSRFNAILEREASADGFYRVDDIQMEMNRIYAAAD
ncbi:hypothetical protein GGI22_004049, partial [Coemansia erecta]